MQVLAACGLANTRQWFIPRPSNPIALAWMAVGRVNTGCCGWVIARLGSEPLAAWRLEEAASPSISDNRRGSKRFPAASGTEYDVQPPSRDNKYEITGGAHGHHLLRRVRQAGAAVRHARR